MSRNWLFLICSLLIVQSIAASYCETFQDDYLKCGLSDEASYDVYYDSNETMCKINYFSPLNKITMDCNNSMLCLDMKLQLPHLRHNLIFQYNQCHVIRYKPLLQIPKRLGIKNVKSVTISSPTMDVRSSLGNSNQVVFSGIQELTLDRFDKMFFVNEQLLKSAKNLKKLHITNSVVQISENSFNNMENLMELQITDNDLRKFDLEALKKVSGLETLVLRSLEKMELNNIPKDIFENYTSIRKIVMNNFNLLKIPDGLFENLETLIELELARNGIRFLPMTPFFNSSGHLMKIDLRFNRLSSIPRNVFKNLYGLKTLLLGYQTSSMIEISGEVFKDLRNLHTMHLSYIGLEKLSYGMFKYVLQLRSLSLAGNSLDYIPKYIFRGLYKLKTLDLSNQENSNILFIEEEAFGDLKMLQTLRLSKNGITFLHEGTFSNLTDLKFLDLSQNGIPKLSENLFSRLIKLETLYLNHQQNLSVISKDAFKSLNMLKHLDLSNNGLKFIPDGVFDNNHNLKILDLHYNRLTRISEATFSGLHNLNYLFINDNFLNEVGLGAFKSLVNLQHANLCKNHLNFDSPQHISPFYKNGKIEVLELCHNNISEIAHDWREAAFLKELNLKGNNLEKLDLKDLIFTSEELVVDLRDNSISRINFVNELMLTSNAIATKRTEIRLQNNKIICNCDLVTFMQLVKHEVFIPADNRVVFSLKNLTCHGPDNMAGKPVLNFDYHSCLGGLNPVEIDQPKAEENFNIGPESEESWVVVEVVSVRRAKISPVYYMVWFIFLLAIIYWLWKYTKSPKSKQFSYSQLDEGHYIENISTQGDVFIKPKPCPKFR